MNPLTINTWKVLTVLNITKYQINLIKLARAGFKGGIYGESACKGDFGPHLKKMFPSDKSKWSLCLWFVTFVQIIDVFSTILTINFHFFLNGTWKVMFLILVISSRVWPELILKWASYTSSLNISTIADHLNAGGEWFCEWIFQLSYPCCAISKN